MGPKIGSQNLTKSLNIFQMRCLLQEQKGCQPSAHENIYTLEAENLLILWDGWRLLEQIRSAHPTEKLFSNEKIKWTYQISAQEC